MNMNIFFLPNTSLSDPNKTADMIAITLAPMSTIEEVPLGSLLMTLRNVGRYPEVR
jgi:hypothetical protein